MIGDDLAGAVRADSLALLDEQVANLSERVFELGRAADRQLFLWLTFAALTVLFGYALAGLVLAAVGLTPAGIAAAVAGIALTMSGNALVMYRT